MSGIIRGERWGASGRMTLVTHPMRVRVVPCAEDCPNEAIAVVPSRDRARYLQTAVVTPAKCVGCGICAGAGDSAGIRLGDEPVSLVGHAVTARLKSVPAAGASGRVLGRERAQRSLASGRGWRVCTTKMEQTVHCSVASSGATVRDRYPGS